MAERVTVQRAVELTGLSAEYIRHGISLGLLPIGAAIKVGKNRTNYYIVPQKLADYLGIPVEKVKETNV